MDRGKWETATFLQEPSTLRGVAQMVMPLPDILTDTLTPEQRAVITHGEGPLLVIAGPGAGKTEVMLRRVAYLVRHRGVPPEALLVTTFTRKATEELRLRLLHLLGQDADHVLISTIHGFCQWLLQAYPQSHAYGRSFQVLDENAQHLFVFSHAKQLGLELPKGRLGDFLAEVIRAFNSCSEELVDAARLVEVLEARGADDDRMAIARAYGRYVELLAKERVLDFAGLQREAYALLQRNPEVRGQVQERFRYIIVDEHQDTNVLQDIIIRIVAAPQDNLCVVGDDDQSIYRFRGATVQNFLRFGSSFEGAGKEVRRIELGRNFRSTRQIVDSTARLIENNTSRYPKRLVAHRGPGPEVLLVEASDVDDEGERLARLIRDLHTQGCISRWADVAVLFSSVKYYAEPLLKALTDLGIPYVVKGYGKFFEREDIRQLKDLVIALGWPSYWRSEQFDGPLLGLQPETKDALEAYRENFWKLDEAGLREIGVVDGRDIEVLARLIGLQRKVQAREHASILGLVHEILSLSGYVAECVQRHDRTALLNVAQFTRLAEPFDRHGRSRSTYRFGEYLWGLPERSLDELQPPTDDAVQLMTIHQAKGLEFPVVIVGSVIEGRLPKRGRASRQLIPDEVAPLVMPSEIAKRRHEKDPDPHITDQRRLLYVGLTRARDLLVVGTSAKVRKQRCKRSRFLDEMELVANEPQPVSRVPDMGKHPSGVLRPHLSFSAINTYLTCPLRYKLLYEDAFAVPTWHFAQFGSSLHHTLEAIHLRALNGELVDETMALGLFEENWIPFGARVEDIEERFKASGRSYIAGYVRGYSATFPRLCQVELGFTYDAGRCLLAGQIDLVRRHEDGTLEIVDFKTRAASGIALIRTDLQLGLYALATEDRLDSPIGHLILHLLADGREEHLDWNPEERTKVRHKLEEVTERLASGDRGATPGRHCQECEFRSLCPYSEVR